MEHPTTVPPIATRSSCWNPTGLVLLVLALEAVALSCCDALIAYRAVSRGSAPILLFFMVPANILGGEGRFITLAAQLALPALAVGLPALLAAWMWLQGRRLGSAAAPCPPVWVAVCLLLAGLVADGVLYRALGGRPDEGAVDVRKKKGPEKVSTDPGAKKAGPNGSEGPGTVSGNGRAAPPDGPRQEKILFSSDRGGTWQIWAMNPDGSGQQQVSRSERVHMQPRLAPDGTRLAFNSLDGEKHLVLVLDLATLQETQICEGDQGTFTGDGKGLVLRREDRVFLRELESGKETMLSPQGWARCAYPNPAPDGSSVAVASRLLAGYNIYLLPQGGGEPKLLVSGKGTCDPRWSPSGKKLSYQTESHIHTINPDGSEPYPVTTGGGIQHYACWSPDEKWIAYCQGPGREGPWQIWKVSLESEDDPVALTKVGSNLYPEWGRVVPLK